MKFRCERDELVEAVSAAGRAVTSRGSSLPVLSGIRFELTGNQLRLTGSDLDTTILVDKTVTGEQDGVAVIPAKLIGDIARARPAGKVEITVDGEDARIEAQRAQFTMRTIPATEFPRLPEPAEEAVVLPAAEFAEALRQVTVAASTEETRPILTGVQMSAEGSGLRLVATDSYRLAVRDLPGTSVLSEGQSVLVPSSALKELGRLLGGADEVRLTLGEREATFTVGADRLTTRLIEGEFPNYRGLIPASQPNRLTVARDALLDAVRRMRLLATDATPVRLVMRAEGLELVAIAQEVGQAHEALDAKYEGAELTVAFNPEYLIAGIEVTPGDEVTLETTDAMKPALLRSIDSNDFLYLLMPVRVS
ncbi:MAG: DNA polymerase III subunit beta [Acidimicrobiales bacterium]